MKKVCFLTAVVCLSLFLTACGSNITRLSQSQLLSHDINSLEKARVDYYGQGGSFQKELNITDNKELMYELYKQVSQITVESHPNPSEMDSQESSPLFLITFSYKNEGADEILTNENGRVIFKRLSGNGWVGGRNDAILKLIKQMENSESDNETVTEIRNALQEIVSKEYGDDEKYLDREVKRIIPLREHNVYFSMAKKLAGAEKADKSYLVELHFPKLEPSASMSSGQLFLEKTEEGWSAWYKYH